MELKEFVSKALKDIIDGVEDVRSESVRDLFLNKTDQSRTVEFDIAVTAEDVVTGKAEAGIKVLSLGGFGGDVSTETKNSTVSRIKFGVHIDTWEKGDRPKPVAGGKAITAGLQDMQF